MKKIVIIDDHQLFRLAIIGILDQESDEFVCQEYGCLKEAIINAASDQADLYLLDISIGEQSGLDGIDKLRKSNPRTKIVVLSSHTEKFYLVKSVEAKVDGYIHKDASPSEVLHGIKKVLNGSKHYSAKVSEIIISDIYNQSETENTLTLREQEIVKYLTDGYSSKEISEILCVSQRTIETHRGKILEKTGVKNTAQLVKMAINNNMI